MKKKNLKFKFNFEELDNNELLINVKLTDSFFWRAKQWDSIIIKKKWISLIISILRNATVADYETTQDFINEYEDCELTFYIRTKETDYSYIKIYPNWKDEKKRLSSISIPYLTRNNTNLMSEFIEPFLVALSQFLPEEERLQLPHPWKENKNEENFQSVNNDPEIIEIATKEKIKKDIIVNFEFDIEECDNDELRINGKRTGTFGGGQQKSIVIQKNWIPWIISTLRNLSVDNYQTGVESIINKCGTCQLTLSICLIGEGYSYIKIFPMWKDEKKISPALEIPYFPWHTKNEQSYTLKGVGTYTRFEFNFEELDNDLKIMSEFIEPFLVALSQFLPKEERKKLSPPWSANGEIRINTRTGSSFGTGSWDSWDSVVIKKEWIPWYPG